MAYGWSAKQMARVNARRARRGQEELSPGPVSQKYIEDYTIEYGKRRAEKPKRRFPETDEDETQVARLGEVETPRLAEGLKKTKAFEDRLREEFLNRNYQKSLMRS